MKPVSAMNKQSTGITPGAGPRKAKINGGPEAVVRGGPAKRVDAGTTTRAQPASRDTGAVAPRGNRR